MEIINKRFVDNVVEAERLWRSAEHLISVTFPVVKDPKLLLRALESLHKSLILSVGNILKFEHISGRVNLSLNKERNLRIFFIYCAGRYGLNDEDKKMIKEIMLLGRKHRESGMEFSKSERFIILDDDMKEYELGYEKMKSLLDVVKRLLINSKSQFRAS